MYVGKCIDLLGSLELNLFALHCALFWRAKWDGLTHDLIPSLSFSDDVPTFSGGFPRHLPSIFFPLFSSCFLFHAPPCPPTMPAPVSKTFAALRNAPASLPLSPSVKALKISFVAKNAAPGPRYVSPRLTYSFTPPLTLPRQFLRQHAPALAYANPLLPIGIHRIPDPRSKHKDPNSPDRDAVRLGRWGGVPEGLQLGTGNVPGGEMVVEFRTSCLRLAASH